MNISDELRVLRARLDVIERALDRGEPDGLGQTVRLCVTATAGHYPRAGAALTTFLVRACRLAGAEDEGAPGEVTPYGEPWPAVNLGAGVPALGADAFLCVQVPGGGWVFTFNG